MTKDRDENERVGHRMEETRNALLTLRYQNWHQPPEVVERAFELILDMELAGMGAPIYVELPSLTWEYDDGAIVASANVIVEHDTWQVTMNAAEGNTRRSYDNAVANCSTRALANMILTFFVGRPKEDKNERERKLN
jgi:hypothetical protein